jgi:hypothetical protein
MKPFYSSEIYSYEWYKDLCFRGLISKCPEKYFNKCFKESNLKGIHKTFVALSNECPNKYLAKIKFTN